MDSVRGRQSFRHRVTSAQFRRTFRPESACHLCKKCRQLRSLKVFREAFGRPGVKDQPDRRLPRPLSPAGREVILDLKETPWSQGFVSSRLPAEGLGKPAMPATARGGLNGFVWQKFPPAP